MWSFARFVAMRAIPCWKSRFFQRGGMVANPRLAITRLSKCILVLITCGKPVKTPNLDALWAQHSAEWRSTAQITSQWQEAAETDPQLLQYRVRGAWWEILAELGITLLVTREYEHLMMAIRAKVITYMRLPHP